MKVAYITRKVFADNSEEVRVKFNNLITEQTIAKAQRTKSINKIKRKARELRIYNKLSKLNFFDPDYNRNYRILINELRLRNISNVIRSARRSRQSLYDICRCNDFEFFVTWTFDSDKVERLNDIKVKRKFTQFQNYLRKIFPNMYYVAVPEYHDNGGLHFHLLIGGVSMDELKAVPARYPKNVGRHKKGDFIFKNGHQIFNVERWKLGYSTLSKVKNKDAVKHYICKYISKQHLDDRFFGKRRYYVSKNIKRPDIQKYCETIAKSFDKIDTNVFVVSYAEKSKGYVVFERDGDGLVRKDVNTSAVLRDLREMRESAERDEVAPTVSRVSAYSTLRTLDRKIDFDYEKKRIERAYFRTIRQSNMNIIRYNREKVDDIIENQQDAANGLDEYYANICNTPIKECEKMPINYMDYCREIGLID